MNERTARDVMLVRSIETADATRDVLSDADRIWAGRAAAEIVGENAPPAAFLGRRAALLLERLAKRHPKLARLARAPSMRGWLMPVALVAAFAIGVAGADI